MVGMVCLLLGMMMLLVLVWYDFLLLVGVRYFCFICLMLVCVDLELFRKLRMLLVMVLLGYMWVLWELKCR